MNSKIRILIINPSANFGGGTTISNILVIGLDKNIFKVFTFFPGKGPAISTLKEEKEINILIPPKSNFYSILFFLYSFLKENKIDIVHAQGTRAAFWTRLVAIRLKNKPKIIYTLHGLHIVRKNFFIRWFLLTLEKFLNRWTSILVCVSEADRNLVLNCKTISSKKIIVIKNGIDTGRFIIKQEEIQEKKKELGLENNFVLCAIGRLHPPKDLSTVLKALKLIISEIPNVKLLIIGDGPLRKSLEKEAEQLRLKEYIKFLGFRENIPVHINLSDIIILSTKWEGLPLIPLEAGACKKPIVASDVDGVRETIIDGKTGFLFKPGSERDLAEKVLKLYFSRDLLQKMGENGYQFVLENFNKEKMLKEYKTLYQSMI